ncbi:MAG: alpha-2-macroglobulin family protein [Polyangiaceae bacterium]
MDRDADGVPDGKDAIGGPIRLRTDFTALAAFAPSVRTGPDGKAAVPVTLPDSVTRYRVMAVAVAGEKQFGKGEATLTARLPLMVRPSPPRFLNFGDRFELPVLLQNQTSAAISVDVAVRTENLTLTSGAGRRITVAAGDRVEVRFPAAAAMAGTARFQIGAATGKHADAAEGSLPVWTPATTEAFATYGEIDAGAISQPVAAPSGVIAELGGLEITTSSTAVSSLTDAVLYLTRYPFECSEQLASRVLAVAALRDVLTAFRAQGLPPPAELEAAVARDIARLATLQNDDGGFGFWRRGEESWPMVGIHVANALVRAKDKRFAVPPPALEKSRAYLRRIETAIPRSYGIDERRVLVAYALAVRARMGDRDVAAARKMVGEAGAKLPLEAAGFLLQVLAGSVEAQTELATVRQLLSQRVTETAGNAHFATAYENGGHVLLASDRRADGVILEGLIADQPKSDLIPKLVSGLMAHRTAGRWGSTQENAFVLLALDRYFGTYEKVTPDFVARAWLGDRFAGEHTFKGRTTERQHVEVPMRELARGAASKDLVIAKDGAGRLYYRVGLRYVPKDTLLPASSNGFTVERAYSGVDAGSDVRRDADGSWRIRAGARVRVRLTMVAPTRRYHVALVDPLPAGLEAVDPSLAVSGSLPPSDQGAASMWRGTWFQHQNLRDERAEAFTTLLWEGQHIYEYVARATTPGSFVVPPPKAEEMYHPETFGRGASDRVIVE